LIHDPTSSTKWLFWPRLWPCSRCASLLRHVSGRSYRWPQAGRPFDNLSAPEHDNPLQIISSMAITNIYKQAFLTPCHFLNLQRHGPFSLRQSNTVPAFIINRVDCLGFSWNFPRKCSPIGLWSKLSVHITAVSKIMMVYTREQVFHRGACPASLPTCASACFSTISINKACAMGLS
jgi:hypothetical protein